MYAVLCKCADFPCCHLLIKIHSPVSLRKCTSDLFVQLCKQTMRSSAQNSLFARILQMNCLYSSFAQLRKWFVLLCKWTNNAVSRNPRVHWYCAGHLPQIALAAPVERFQQHILGVCALCAVFIYFVLTSFFFVFYCFDVVWIVSAQSWIEKSKNNQKFNNQGDNGLSGRCLGTFLQKFSAEFFRKSVFFFHY